MSKYILALHAGHNASATIGDAGGIIHAVQEERLTKEKNFWGYPAESIRACFAAANATPKDLAAVVTGNAVVLRRHRREEVLESFARHRSRTGRIRQRILMPAIIRFAPNYGQGRLRAKLAESGLGDVPTHRYDHHRMHALTAYYGLRRDPKTRYLVVTCDGSGDGLCASARVVHEGREELISTTPMENSLGALYSWVTYATGFVPFEHEYKLMGMAPYASERAAREHAALFEKYIGLSEDGLSLLRKTRDRISNQSDQIFADLVGRRFDYICAGLQLFTEELLERWVANLVRHTGVGRVLAGGGVFMNVKANQRLAAIQGVESFEAFPSCGDETLSIGQYYHQAALTWGQETVKPLRDFYLGDAVSDAEAEAELRKTKYEWKKPGDMAEAVTDLLVAGEPVARCAGKMEFGARALGNRSILADPMHQDVVRVINQMVKKRDFWMPFAPMVAVDRHGDYVKNDKALRSPYMMMTFDARSNYKDFIGAVHNADLTCRAQLLEEGQNDGMMAILRAFERRTGRAVVLNTSFNLHGWPIVRTAAEALEVFEKSGLRHMQVGSFLVSKPADG